MSSGLADSEHRHKCFVLPSRQEDQTYGHNHPAEGNSIQGQSWIWAVHGWLDTHHRPAQQWVRDWPTCLRTAVSFRTLYSSQIMMERKQINRSAYAVFRGSVYIISKTKGYNNTRKVAYVAECFIAGNSSVAI